MRDGTKAEIETTPRCSHCEASLEYNSCIDCQKPILNKERFNMGDNQIYCYGPKGENWHRCNTCYTNLERLKCPKCGLGQERISRYAKDTIEGIMIVNTCKECKTTWENKMGESK